MNARISMTDRLRLHFPEGRFTDIACNSGEPAEPGLYLGDTHHPQDYSYSTPERSKRLGGLERCEQCDLGI